VSWLTRLSWPAFALVSHPEIMQLYGWGLVFIQPGVDFSYRNHGSIQKNKILEEAGRLYSELSRNLIERTTPSSVSGGVIGDLGGFAAALMRGIPLIHSQPRYWPRLTAASGKTAVNSGNIKTRSAYFTSRCSF
jgi:3-dehydroquinate synthetase